MTVEANSRYNHSAIIRTEGPYGLLEPDHLDIRPRVYLNDYRNVGAFNVSSKDTFSLIAWKRLGDSKLWWIIADISDVIDPIAELHPPADKVFMTQLTTDWTDGAYAHVGTVRGLAEGQTLVLENLISGESAVLQVGLVSKESKALQVIRVSGDTAVPAGGSRLSRIHDRGAQLTVPGYSKAVMGPLDFGNQIQTLEEV